MKTLYFLHFGACVEPGVKKKINAQIEQLGKYVEVKEVEIREEVEHPGILRKISTNMLLIYARKLQYQVERFIC